DLYRRIAFAQNAVGAVPGPFDSWLVLRGLKTLAVRMERHEKNAMAVASWLEKHRRVRKVLYPGLPSFEHHETARRQMSGFGALISFYVEGGGPAALEICRRTRVFTLAE